MKKIKLKGISFVLVFTLCVGVFAGCSNNTANTTDNSSKNTDSSQSSDFDTETATELNVQFGDRGDSFVMHLYDNDTAKAIARYVGTSDWRLPIYNYEGYENWEVMQYYDVPSRYDIPSNPETVSEEKSGTVYYSEPNRIVLYYGDAKVTAEYTPVGYFDDTEEFRNAVKDNPVLEGWGNKIVVISD